MHRRDAAVVAIALVAAGCLGDVQSGGPLVGEPAPPITVQPLDAPAWDLAGMRGRVVLLDLMGVNCAPCRLEMEHLTQVARAHADDASFAMLSIDMAALYPGLGAHGTDDIRRFRDEYNATWPFAPDWNGTVGRAYEPITLPTLLVIGPDGVIRMRWSGGIIDVDRIEAAVGRARGQ